MDRKEILEKLARKEITQEEAERLLTDGGAPIPETPPPPPRTKSGKGYLIAIIIAVVLAPAVLLGIVVFLLVLIHPEESPSPAKAYSEFMPKVPESTAVSTAKESEPITVVIDGTPVSIIVDKKDKEIIMDANRELDERLAHIRKMERDKKITAAEAEKLIQAVKDWRD